MKNVTLSIPDMQSTHCQARVNAVINTFEEVKIEKLEAGKLTVLIGRNEIEEELLSAIKNAGYTVIAERNENSSSCTTGCCG
ncbi:copper chaperone [Sphingobacterium puteale]|uniref:Copper chaperone n=1 Tax=Sphingobacterium puteale TaxID=2420510 RepID=A0A420VTS6_9SPHI|nr:heavy-metal-associated domain-containing protein [Sphingobacterium puteale]RKO69722.1 copper chaperone [Sphingobacterium puteale]